MKIKIQLKTVFGKLIFEYEKENNTIKDTLIEALQNGADLSNADLSDADLRGAYFRGAYLSNADLRGAKENKINIKKIAVFTGLYQYSVYAIIDSRNSKWIKMGCYLRRLKEWEKDFWNNTSEFPNDNSEKSQLRLFAFETAKQWFNIVK